MPAPVITITRQYGAGGSEVARLVAHGLGWTVIDNEFVDEVAQREERAPGLLERLARTLAVGSPEVFVAGGGVPQVEETESAIVKMAERVIAEAAKTGRVVLVGRGAQAYLGTREDTLHVYLVASKEFRARIAVEKLGVDPKTVLHTLDEVDRRRDRYVKTYYGRVRTEPVNYDLALNTERLGFDGAAALVAAEARRRGWR